MDTEDTLVVLRVLNRSGESFRFQTAQGIEVLLTPGSIVDLYSFEVDGVELFENERHSDSLRVVENQSVQMAAEVVERIRADMSAYRQGEPYEESHGPEQQTRPSRPASATKRKAATKKSANKKPTAKKSASTAKKSTAKKSASTAKKSTTTKGGAERKRSK